MLFPTFFNLNLNLAIRSSWSEPQSAPSLVFAYCREPLHLWLQRIQSIWFQCWPSGDVHVENLLLCCWTRVFAMTNVYSLQNSISLCPASFCTPRPNLPVTPGVSWLPTFAFQMPNKASFPLDPECTWSCKYQLRSHYLPLHLPNCFPSLPTHTGSTLPFYWQLPFAWAWQVLCRRVFPSRLYIPELSANIDTW